MQACCVLAGAMIPPCHYLEACKLTRDSFPLWGNATNCLKTPHMKAFHLGPTADCTRLRVSVLLCTLGLHT